METAIALNGSPRMEKGYTCIVLDSFVKGMSDAGCSVDLFYADKLDINPCCGELHCWRSVLGECCIRDEMDVLHPKLRSAQALVLATPVYTPMPGGLQNIINRLVSLYDPVHEIRRRRTGIRLRKDVEISKLVLVSTCGWWEMGNFGTVVRVVAEVARKLGIVFSGAVLRPHASLMREGGQLTKDGEAVLRAVQDAGRELIQEGEMRKSTLAEVSRPLITRGELTRLLNEETWETGP